MARPIRIVVGEGRTAQRGLLRFVLEGEGFDVVGEARGSADLSGVIEEKRPDVVVLDDGIGVMAVSMVHEVAPDTKIVLVWPSAIVPIGGDARVEPAKILKDLGPTVEHVAAGAVGLTETFQRPDWIDRIRKDPATLREKLGNSRESAKRPSVTRLQKGARRLHPIGRRPSSTGRGQREEGVPAPVVVLPSGDGDAELEPILDIGGSGTASGPAEDAVPERSEWNRRLGTLALSGAAAVSALVLALALGGGRMPVSVVRGGGTLPPGAGGFIRPGSSIGDPSGTGSLGGSGYDPIPVPEPPVGSDSGGSGGVIGGIDAGLGGDLASPGTGGSDEPPTVGGPGDGGPTGGGGGGGGNGGGGNGGGGGGGNGGGGGGGNGGGGSKGAKDGLPGKSAEHNPHGGPPSKLGQTPAHGQGLGAATSHHAKSKHVHKH